MIYDQKIAPLIHMVHDLCVEHGIPMCAYFSVPDEGRQAIRATVYLDPKLETCQMPLLAADFAVQQCVEEA